MPDEKLKLQWLNEMDWKDDVVAVFDDRDKVVNMWRENGLTCMQVAYGNFQKLFMKKIRTYEKKFLYLYIINHKKIKNGILYS